MQYYSNLPLSQTMAKVVLRSFDLTSEPKSLLDMCCGAGTITTELFKIYNCGNMQKISLVDINLPPQEILNDNKINFIQSNLFEKVPLYQYDRIYSLYPCFTEQEYNILNQIKNIYYPKEAFCVPEGEDKFYFLRNIMLEGSKYLSDNGLMILHCLNESFVNYCKNITLECDLEFYDINYELCLPKRGLEQFVILKKE